MARLIRLLIRRDVFDGLLRGGTVRFNRLIGVCGALLRLRVTPRRDVFTKTVAGLRYGSVRHKDVLVVSFYFLTGLLSNVRSALGCEDLRLIDRERCRLQRSTGWPLRLDGLVQIIFLPVRKVRTVSPRSRALDSRLRDKVRVILR